MTALVLGLVLFAGTHLVLAVPPLKEQLRASLGRTAYAAGFAVAPMLALVLIVWGYAGQPAVAADPPPAWGRPAALGLMLLACLFLGIFLFRGSLRRRLRFPFAIAVVLWAAAHLAVNGDRASLVLFGGMLAYALAHLGLGLAYGAQPAGEVRAGHDLLSLVAGLAIFVAMIQLHPPLIGVAVWR